jgi:hydrogenase maturation protease
MMKLLAMGNILMGDDGIAVYVAGKLEKELHNLGIEVIYGETDIGYCITQIGEEDSLILADAAYPDKNPGRVSVFTLEDISNNGRTHHSVRLSDICKIYFPKVRILVIAIEVHQIEFSFGLSQVLKNKIPEISEAVLQVVEKIKNAGIDSDRIKEAGAGQWMSLN